MEDMPDYARYALSDLEVATPVENRGGGRSKIAAPSPYILWVLTVRSSPSLRAGAVRRAF